MAKLPETAIVLYQKGWGVSIYYRRVCGGSKREFSDTGRLFRQQSDTIGQRWQI